MTYADHLRAARIRLGQVAVVLSPVGPRCTVRTARGLVLHGYRVPDDYQPHEHEVVYWGRCVRARFVDAKDGRPVEDWDGNPLLEGKGAERRLATAETYRLEVEPAEPPELR